MKRLLAFILLGLAFAAPAAAQEHPVTRNTTNVSGSITTGNTFQQILAAVNPSTAARGSITIENNNTNGDNCWVFLGANASATKATAILLGQGGSYQRYYPYVPADAIQITCTTTADTFYADWQ